MMPRGNVPPMRCRVGAASRLRTVTARSRARTNMRTDDLDFDLPPELIAQSPAANRAASRLLHYRRHSRAIVHRQFSDLPDLLRPGDLLVFNDARVIPARFMLRKVTGGLVEGLFLADEGDGVWR